MPCHCATAGHTNETKIETTMPKIEERKNKTQNCLLLKIEIRGPYKFYNLSFSFSLFVFYFFMLLESQVL